LEGLVRRSLPVSFGLVLAVSIALWGSIPSAATAADGAGDPASLTAFLDGKPIPLADASKYSCDDFSYPIIQCSVNSLVMATRATLVSLLSSVDYVSIYEFPSYSGSMMNVSQDYPALATIGWNDKISSFKARNSLTGTFFVDWFYGGSQWSFCCNTQQSSLGGYDNTFSAVQRT
jgi:hypothetical protein